jgi:hypothetical protein
MSRRRLTLLGMQATIRTLQFRVDELERLKNAVGVLLAQDLDGDTVMVSLESFDQLSKLMRDLEDHR